MITPAEEHARQTVIAFAVGAMLFFGLVCAIASMIFKRQGKSTKNLWTRYFAFFVMIPVIVIPLVWNATAFQVTVMLLSMLGFLEFSRATGLSEDRWVVAFVLFGMGLVYAPIFVGWYGLYQATPAYAIVLLLLFSVWRGEYKGMVHKVSLAVLAIIYFGWFFSHLAYLRNFGSGLTYIAYFLFLVIGNDAFAYLTGNLFGRHKLIPELSPNKTVEGFLGAMVLVVLAALALRPFLVPHLVVRHAALLGLIIAIGGTSGDLTLSFIKRDLGIKDMGTLIPGHGGLLDRMNSILFTAPLFFHVVRFFYGEA
jgi:phosphatidate cytidylyltransferase